MRIGPAGSEVPFPQVLVVCSEDPGRSTADLLVRHVTAGSWALPVSEVRIVRLCPSCGSNDHGRPLVAPIPGRTAPWVSISRAAGLTVVALSTVGPVGVDVEHEASAGFANFAAVALHHSESADGPREQTVTWVRKESLVKATGAGLRLDPTLVRLSGPTSTPPSVIDWPGLRWPTSQVHLYDVEVAPDHVAAVTVLAETRPDLVVSRHPPAAVAGRGRATSRRTAR